LTSTIPSTMPTSKMWALFTRHLTGHIGGQGWNAVITGASSHGNSLSCRFHGAGNVDGAPRINDYCGYPALTSRWLCDSSSRLLVLNLPNLFRMVVVTGIQAARPNFTQIFLSRMGVRPVARQSRGLTWPNSYPLRFKAMPC
jgi:hypothetical protein